MASIEVYESLTRPPSAAWRASIYRGVRDKRRNPAIMNMLKCGIRGESQRRATGQGLTSPRAHRDGRLNCSHSPSNPLKGPIPGTGVSIPTRPAGGPRRAAGLSRPTALSQWHA
jgi:hypothetical protein